jgi:hypothetical protein
LRGTNSFDPLKDEVMDFRTNLCDVITVAAGKSVDTTGITTGKKSLKQGIG